MNDDDKKLDKILAAVEANAAALKKVQATVEDHGNRLNETAQMFTALANHVDERLEPITNDISQIKNSMSTLTSAVDKALGDYSRLDDEETVSTALIKQANDKIENHEQRIGKLEEASA